ncbi:MAG: VWA domain-containing protein [Polyangiaceae bacterium]
MQPKPTTARRSQLASFGLLLLGALVGCQGGRDPEAQEDAAATAQAAPPAPMEAPEAASRDEAKHGSSPSPAAAKPGSHELPAASASPEADEDIAATPSDGESGGLRGRGFGAGKGRMGDPLALLPGGGVRAGEWDDNANYLEFQRFLTTSSRLPFHAQDLRHRRFLVVRDQAGKAVPSCRVEVSDGARSVPLTTAASGRAILFPHAEGLSGWNLTASARCQGEEVARRFDLQASDEAVTLDLPTYRQLPAVPTIDVAFILDSTGSMSEEIAAVKATIQKVTSSLSDGQARIRLGLVEYKDRSDDQATRVYPMSFDHRAFARSVEAVRATGGGDIPEDAVQGLQVGVDQLAWNDQAVARLAFMIGDAPPHLDYQDGGSYEGAAKKAAHRGIKIFTVAASGMDDLGQVVWRQIAQYTGGTNLFVMRGGAGPQSVGGGDPKSSCGGTQESYTSGNLDQLIVAKVERELRALNADPMAIAGLGGDERAKPCDQRVAQN